VNDTFICRRRHRCAPPRPELLPEFGGTLRRIPAAGKGFTASNFIKNSATFQDRKKWELRD
jgi:hypothetical protein